MRTTIIARKNNGGENNKRGKDSSSNYNKGAAPKEAVVSQEVSGMYRMYLAYSEGKVGRVTYNSLGEKVKKSGKTMEPERESLRCNVLEALVDGLRRFEDVSFDNLTMPIAIFVPNTFFKVLLEENYKIWLMSGHFLDGKPVPVEELELWEEFETIRSKYNKIMMIREIGDNSKTVQNAKDSLDLIDISLTTKCWNRVKVTEEIEIEEE